MSHGAGALEREPIPTLQGVPDRDGRWKVWCEHCQRTTSTEQVRAIVWRTVTTRAVPTAIRATTSPWMGQRPTYTAERDTPRSGHRP